MADFTASKETTNDSNRKAGDQAKVEQEQNLWNIIPPEERQQILLNMIKETLQDLANDEGDDDKPQFMDVSETLRCEMDQQKDTDYQLDERKPKAQDKKEPQS